MARAWWTYRAKRKLNNLGTLLSSAITEKEFFSGIARDLINSGFRHLFSYAEITRARGARVFNFLLHNIPLLTPILSKIEPCLDILPIKRSKAINTPRYYLRSGLSPQDFFTGISKVQYVVLRWADHSNYLWNHTSDLDILVRTTDLSTLLSFCTKTRGAYPLDIYTDEYCPGHLHNSYPYYPYKLASCILNNRSRKSNGMYMPQPDIHFLSFVYHILFHKASYIWSTNRTKSFPAATSIRYLDELLRLHSLCTTCYLPLGATKLQDVSKDILYSVLEESSFLPSISNSRFIALHNPELLRFLKSKYIAHGKQANTGNNNESDLIVFILRDRLLEQGHLNKVIKTLQTFGLSVAFSSPIHPSRRPEVIREIRSGDWSGNSQIRGVSGGKPAHIIACLDHDPDYKNRTENISFPFVHNNNVRLYKTRLRKTIESHSYFWDQCHLIHSSDDYDEALEYLQISLLPSELETASIAISSHISNFKPQTSAFSQLSNFRYRSRVDLLASNNQAFIRKTYRLDQLSYFDRELEFYNRYQGLLPFVPRMLASTSNSFDLEIVRGVPASRLLEDPSNYDLIKSTIRLLLQSATSHGFAFVDLNHENLIFDSSLNPWIIDYEYSFIYPPGENPRHYLQGYDVIGLPANYAGPVPPRTHGNGRTYNNTWLEYLGPL